MRFATSLALAAALAGCSSLRVHSDWNTTVDFTKYKTFDLQHDSMPLSALAQERVRTAISNTLTSKGLTRDAHDPELRVIWRVNLSSKTEYATVQTGGYAYGPAWGGWGGYGATALPAQTEVPLGALTIAIIDTKLNHLVWRGEADARLDEGQSNPELLQQALQQMFAQFPTKPGVMPASTDF